MIDQRTIHDYLISNAWLLISNYKFNKIKINDHSQLFESNVLVIYSKIEGHYQVINEIYLVMEFNLNLRLNGS